MISKVLLLFLRSTLALLVAGIYLANHITLAFTFYNTAMLTTLFNRRIYFHNKFYQAMVKPTHENVKRLTM